jgi:4'-phosphopantetheinyl transferase
MSTTEQATQYTNVGEEILAGKCVVITDSVYNINSDIALLTEEERARANRFHRIEDRDRYIATRTFIREIISATTGIKLSAIEFGKTEKGKPYLKDNKEIHFSISHSNSRIAITVSKGYECGCDIEETDSRKISDDIIQTHFHKNEITMMEQGNKTTCFYQCWTRKEALYKAFGSGLPDDLASVDSTKSLQKINGTFFQLKTFQLIDGYILSIATSGDQAREIIVHER